MSANKRLVIYPWSMDSEPAKRLSKVLGALRVYGFKDYVPRDGDFIIDWGRSDCPKWGPRAEDLGVTILNHWSKIRNSVDKLRSFLNFQAAGVRHVPFTVSGDEAEAWSKAGYWVCCRQELAGYDGRGLVLAKSPKELVWAPLYTLFIPAKYEFRVYVFRNRIIDVLEKYPEHIKANKDVRTEANGWNYSRDWAFESAIDWSEAIKAIKANGLDFGGVDMIQSKEDGKLYVLETNTAPDIYQESAKAFAEEIFKLYAKE